MSTMPLSRRQWLALAAAVAAAASPSVRAADPYPAKALRLVVPFAPGGGNDAVARVLADRLGPLLGQPVVVDNRAGAGGNIGTDLVAKAPPDGHTLLHVANTVVMNPSLYRTLPFDVQKDLQPVGLMATTPLLLLVHPSVPAQTLGELLALARQGQMPLAYASPGNGTPHHFAMELLKARSGAQIAHVPYKGGGPAVTDVLGGQLQVLVATPQSVTDFVANGRLRLLATFEPARAAPYAQVPTVAETVPDAQVTIWHGLMAPAGTPPAMVKTVSDALARALDDLEVKKRLATIGFTPRYEPPTAMASRIGSELVLWKGVAKSAGIVPE